MNSNTIPKWREDEIQFLIENYPQHGRAYCVEHLGRFNKTVAKKIRELKLTLDKSGQFWLDFQRRAALSKVGKQRPDSRDRINALRDSGKLERTPEIRSKLSIAMKRRIESGYSAPSTRGTKLSESHRKALTEGRKRAALDKSHITNSPEFRQRLSDNMKKTIASNGIASKGYSRGNSGKRNDIGIYVRSTWEANYARYLNHMRTTGKILDWVYEPKRFEFDKIKRGSRSYLPDFLVTRLDGSQYYIEVKGWLDQTSKTKLKRMAKYYPSIELEVVTSKEYKEICKNFSHLPNWE